MENRDRDKLSQSEHSTSAGSVNRKTSSNVGNSKSDSSAQFGQKIGRSENSMNEPSRRSGSGSMESGSGRTSGSSGLSGSSNVSGNKSSDIDSSSSIGSGENGRSSRGGSRQ